ncbi:phage tail assembly chaperone G [Thermoactinomyces sp. DSM 45892]|uniref:phage tail assembly chaperone G n=1 Tax=Thermoactinomyces sp. DSM 45892 TaxID=1882753 RepID=UPI0008944D3D|nr:hypothetical protein [Thermoactinomyces sp. DSM 45892]SDY84822.1 hypothetical protein SAMN05444416_10963 [Thermoactinomyces sp. DSM 45892]
MWEIKLYLDKEWKTFSTDFISGRMFRKSLELDDRRNKFLQKALEHKELDRVEQDQIVKELFSVITQVFDNQFSIEQYEEGTDARKIADQSWSIIHGIIGQTLEPLSSLASEEDDLKKTLTSR